MGIDLEQKLSKALAEWKNDKDKAVSIWKDLTGNVKSEGTLKNYFYGLGEVLAATNKKTVTGVFSDPHIPFDHPGYLPFITDTFEMFGVNRVVCDGDLVDNHAISRHLTHPEAMGAEEEFLKTKAKVKEYSDRFPDVYFVRGNHDSIPLRQAAEVGLSRRFLKDLHEVWEFPKGWQVSEQFVLDDVVYQHGLGCGGKDGAFNAALAKGMSTVIGHSHSYGGIKYRANEKETIFGLNVGCGIEEKAYAFEYGKWMKYRPTLGCGIVFNKEYAIYVPMGEKYLNINNFR